jgi:hypothetical protein
VNQIGRTWKLWAHRYASGKFHHVGARKWVELHGITHPLVPVLVEEILDDLYVSEITHYGWQYAEGSRHRHGDAPTMIQVRAGNDPKDPKRALMLLSMCFPYGLDAAIKDGDGNVIALRITERQEEVA